MADFRYTTERAHSCIAKEMSKLKEIEVRELLNDFFQDVDSENIIDADIANGIVDAHLRKFINLINKHSSLKEDKK